MSPSRIDPDQSPRASATRALLERAAAAWQLAPPELDGVLGAIRTATVAPRAAAFHEGDVCPRVFVVRQGLLKQLYTREDGSEWIKSFAAEGDLFACPLAFVPGGRTSFASVAIEPSVVESVEWRVLEALAERHVAWQKLLRLGFQRLAERKVRRERDLLLRSAAELYAELVQETPALATRVPQKDLAAYLGVTAAGLNRIVRRSRRAGGR